MAARNFFGDGSLTIKYKGKPVIVWPLVKNKILRDREGNIYLTWWPTPDDLPSTPTQRERYKWRKEQIAYRRFPDGLVSCERALLYATLSGEIKFSEIEELKALAEKVNAELTILDEENTQLVGELKKDVATIAKAIEHAQSLPLVEAQNQVVYLALFRDKLGRVNVGVLRCRSATIAERLRERLEAISFWSSDYRVRYAMVKDINEKFYRALDRFKKALEIDLEKLEVALKEKKAIKKYLEARLITYADFFQRWFGIKPYHNWVKHTIVDLNSARMYLDWSEMLDVQRVLQKLIIAARYKMAHQAIDQAIFITADVKPKKDGLWRYDPEITQELVRLIVPAYENIETLPYSLLGFGVSVSRVITHLRIVAYDQLENGFYLETTLRSALKDISKSM